MTSWDDAYTGSPPWDIGRPHQPFIDLAERGLLTGRLLDVGCGTGEQTLLAASHGADALGVDLSPRALGRARSKAEQRSIAATFAEADVLDLTALGEQFDIVLDSCVFHTFNDADRARYVQSLAAATHPGSHYYMLCFSTRTTGDWGPRRVTEPEIRQAFADSWTVDAIDEVDLGAGAVRAEFASTAGDVPPDIYAWFCTIVRR